MGLSFEHFKFFIIYEWQSLDSNYKNKNIIFWNGGVLREEKLRGEQIEYVNFFLELNCIQSLLFNTYLITNSPFPNVY